MVFIAEVNPPARGHPDSGEANLPASGREWPGREEALEEILEEVRRRALGGGLGRGRRSRGSPEEGAGRRSGRRQGYEVVVTRRGYEVRLRGMVKRNG